MIVVKLTESLSSNNMLRDGLSYLNCCIFRIYPLASYPGISKGGREDCQKVCRVCYLPCVARFRKNIKRQKEEENSKNRGGPAFSYRMGLATTIGIKKSVATRISMLKQNS